MRHDEFAERAARRLEAIADRLETESDRLGIDGRISARAKELRVAAFMVRDEAVAVSREEGCIRSRESAVRRAVG